MLKEELISTDQLLCAIQTLRECVKRKEEKQFDLFENDGVYFQFSMKKILPGPTKSIKIMLPHSQIKKTTDVCLFVKDEDRESREYEATIRHYEDIFKKHAIYTKIEIFPLKKLKLEFNDFESKRNLSNMFDVFLADARIVRLLPSYLGKHFVGRKKFLVQVRLDVDDLLSEIDKALRTTLCILSNRGSTFQVAIGKLCHSDEQLVDNIRECLSKIISSDIGGQENIRGIVMKTQESLSVPLYISYGSKMDVDINREQLDEHTCDIEDNFLVEKKDQKFGCQKVDNGLGTSSDDLIGDEVSTVLDGRVLVTERGDVIILNKDGKSVKRVVIGKQKNILASNIILKRKMPKRLKKKRVL